MKRAAHALGLTLAVGCTSAAVPPPGEIVLGTFNLTTRLVGSSCPFDLGPDGQPLNLFADGGLNPDGGGLSPIGLDIPWTVSVTPAQQRIYLSAGGQQRQGTLEGRTFVIESTAVRSICGAAFLDERYGGTFYGPPQVIGPHGCPLLAGPGLFPDGGPWPLALPQLPDGGSVDGGLVDGGDASCFQPAGLLDGATFVDGYSALPDAGADGGLECQAPDAGDLSCAATYSMQGVITL